MCKLLSIVLAGGTGSRLRPLTQKQCKPALAFAYQRRIIDFVLSNLWHSGFHQVMVLTQYRPAALHRHLNTFWQPRFNRDGQLKVHQAPSHLQQGTAGAVASLLDVIQHYHADVIAILSADHIYKMDYRQMLAFHQHHKAAVTVAAVAVPVSHAHQFGIITTDKQQRVCGFAEKPSGNIKQIKNKPGYALASMGNYLFNANYLCQLLAKLASDKPHDFGHDILPKLFNQQQACVYDFSNNTIPGQQSLPQYWQDVGTLSAYFQSKLDILHHPEWLEGNTQLWPILASELPKSNTKHCVSKLQRNSLDLAHPLYF
ncbi:sugar phosphate nucleotidyltransferase [Rheinheimera baltica]|uniref:Sugar phosphate nucleotidyltransferase n=1 Tax=Rheinheimera baltica TaxID=67576 RepID=A0ABT9I129_9GAMM|nr:sugar phosphate nucleotidyltransferase [Rheinheimera baltica]MDP5136621.1 sugar phosphate nucleotidyltransferase [Rheinheimera baltica]MDP5144070.1 sugar phosphate nucleotidyltransferase [Rheinheimera baltica]MDP5148880.1 sugar phosphate nucleotidyltransferase [Rheinheimera baltica]